MSAQTLMITESDSYEFDIGNYSATYIERAVKSYERKQDSTKSYYERMKQNPEWVKKRKQQARASRLKKKMELASSSSSSSPSSTSS